MPRTGRMHLARIAVSVLLATAAACGGSSPSATPAAPTTPAPAEAPVAEAPAASLYDRLGGKPAIEAVIDKFLEHVVADARISARFATLEPAAVTRLRNHLVDQVCMATGGPCQYTGKNMVEAHAGMGVTEAEFTALVEDLVKALDHYKVPRREQDELLGALGGMKGDIVGK